MDHSTIEEQSWIERYHQGRLPPQDEARFEAHFVDCKQCMEQLELARGFQRGIKTMVAEDAAAVTAVGLFAWLAQRGRVAQLGLAFSAVLVAIGLPYLWFRAENQQLRLAANTGIAINTPVFLLSAVRSEADEPGVMIDLSGGVDRLALAVDVGDDPTIETYRATVVGFEDQLLWQQAGLVPNALETVLITFPASFFAAGDYRLGIEGLRGDGTAVDLGGYRFRVLLTR